MWTHAPPSCAPSWRAPPREPLRPRLHAGCMLAGREQGRRGGLRDGMYQQRCVWTSTAATLATATRRLRRAPRRRLPAVSLSCPARTSRGTRWSARALSWTRCAARKGPRTIIPRASVPCERWARCVRTWCHATGQRFQHGGDPRPDLVPCCWPAAPARPQVAEHLMSCYGIPKKVILAKTV